MFRSDQFFPDALVARLTCTRVDDPEFAFNAAQARVRRPRLTVNGKLNILAADHPARNVTKVGGDAFAMADRRDYLARIVRVLGGRRVDGVMATMDILEDLLSIDGFLRVAGAPTLLDHKLLIASLNRGGLAGSSWELDDPIAGPTPLTCQTWRLDGTKMLLRVDPQEPASLRTLQMSAAAITESNALRLPFFLEPLPVTRTEEGPTSDASRRDRSLRSSSKQRLRSEDAQPVTRTDKGYTVVKTADALARLAGVASALGDSSRYLWLKLPYCEDYGRVARATTLPILLLGGESAGDPAPFLRQLESALHAGANVRGALVGRNVLYPGAEDPLAMAEAAGGIVHECWSVDQALDGMASIRGTAMDRLTAWL